MMPTDPKGYKDDIQGYLHGVWMAHGEEAGAGETDLTNEQVMQGWKARLEGRTGTSTHRLRRTTGTTIHASGLGDRLQQMVADVVAARDGSPHDASATCATGGHGSRPSVDTQTTHDVLRTFMWVDLALRSLLQHYLHQKQTVPETDVSHDRSFDLVDMALACSDLGYCDPVIPIHLIQDLVDARTTEACQDLFGYLERRGSILTQARMP